jgi:hypothetical protein
MEYCKIFVPVIDESWPTFSLFSVHEQKLMKLRQYRTVFPSYFNNIFLKYFGLLQNLMRNSDILQYLTRLHIINKISSNFSGITLPFHEVSKCFVDLQFLFLVFLNDDSKISVSFIQI